MSETDKETRNETNFRKDVEALINHHSLENWSNTPDFILAEYLSDCLITFDKAIRAREKFYGREVTTP
jgi:hypothetical protein